LVFNKSYVNISPSIIRLEHNSSNTINASGNVTLNNGSFIHSNLFLYVNNLFVDSGSFISADGLGFLGGDYDSNGSGPGAGIYYSGVGGSGAGYGGSGGNFKKVEDFYDGGKRYGDWKYPLEYGSGGAGGYNVRGGLGGGLLYLNISNRFDLFGNLSSKGFSGFEASYGRSSGGGSGGSILINTTYFYNYGDLSVIGGDGQEYSYYNTFSGAGSGGRIGIYTNNYFGNSKIYRVYGGKNSEEIEPGTVSLNGVFWICDEGDYSSNCIIKSPKTLYQNLTLNNLIFNKSYVDLIPSIVRLEHNSSNMINAIGDVTLNNETYIHSNLFLYANNLFVDSKSYISADGLGFKGGGPKQNGSGPGGGIYFKTGAYSGIGSGAGYGGTGGRFSSTYIMLYGGKRYGNWKYPLDYGSGGAGSYSDSGGSGGGLLYLNISNRFDLFGNLSSIGEKGKSGTGGSGGSILIDSNIFQSSGKLSVVGGNCSQTLFFSLTVTGCGSGGRMSIFTNNFIDNSKIFHLYSSSSYLDVDPGTLAINGVYWVCDEGDYSNNCIIKSPKTLYEDVNLTNLIFKKTYSDLIPSIIRLEHNSSNILNASGVINITDGGYIHSNLFLYANDLYVDSNSYISADGLGFIGGMARENGSGIGKGFSGGVQRPGSGGGYGGAGGATSYGFGGSLLGGISYGNMTNPLDYGSGGGGGDTSPGGSGGGLIYINVLNRFDLFGNLTSNGEKGLTSYYGPAGSGSGGSIFVNSYIFASNGTISAFGPDAYTYYSSVGGSGAGGRIAFYCGNHDKSLIADYISVSGGLGAGKGTFYNHNNVCNIAPLIDYIYPTPIDNARISKDNIIIRITSIKDINSCKIVFNGTNYSMTKIDNKNCEGILNTSNLGQKMKYEYYVIADFLDDIGNFKEGNKRYFTYYWPNEKIREVPSFGLFSLLVFIVILLFWRWL
jgi:hypothetical protein